MGGSAVALVVWATAVFAAAHHVIWPVVVALVALVGAVAVTLS